MHSQEPWTPATLLELSGGYWSTCALHAGVKLDLFTPLTGQVVNARTLAGIRGLDVRALAMLLDALTALKLLEKEVDVYGATPFAAEFLSRTSPNYLGHIILHHHHLMQGWSQVHRAVESGGPLGGGGHMEDAQVRESFLMGMFNLAMQLAPRIVPQIDLSGRRRLLDLGGGPGTYAVHFCLHNPHLEAVVYDLPSTRTFAEKTIERFGLSGRIVFKDGDYLTRGIEGTYDVAWLSHILHGESSTGCAVILEKAVSSLEKGGMIMVQEFILDDDRKGPLFPALFSLNMLLNTSGGKAYTQSELIGMLAAAGAVNVVRLPLELPNGAGVVVGEIR